MTMTRPMVRGLVRPMARTLTEGVGVPDLAAEYFARVTSGGRWGFLDLTRVYTTHTGETQVSAAGNAIGLFLDDLQWGGRTLAQELAGQAELVTNGAFSVDANWTKEGAWAISGGVASFASGANANLFQPIPSLVEGRNYNCRVDLTIGSGTLSNYLTNQLAAGANQSWTTSGSKSSILLQPSGTGALVFRSTNGVGITIDNASLKLIPGNAGSQATGGNRGTWQTGGVLRVATDDGYLTNLLPGKFVMARAKLTGGSGTRVALGASDSATARFNSYFNSSGQAACRVGDGAEIAAGSDRTGVDGSIGLRIRDADSEVDLLIDGVVAATAALSGAPTTAQRLAIGASNNNGTLGSFFTGDFLTGANGASIVAGDAVPTDAELAALHAYLMAA